MFRLADWPIRRKLGFLTGIGALVALLLASAAFAIHDVWMIRAAKVKQITALADILGFNATTALEFYDPVTAEDVLSSLRLQPSVEVAALFDAQGELLATYPAQPSVRQTIGTCPPAADARFTGQGFLVITQDIHRDGERVGTVYLRSNLKEIDKQLVQVAWIALAVMTVSLAVAMLITGRLQRLFTAPIHELAKVMKYISAGGDPSLHVKKLGRDEMGVLCDGFNTMLDQIEVARDELQHANDLLEERVMERTKELQGEIAERKRAEKELAKAKDAAETANRAKSEFLANMSHEIRTPMTAILGFSDILAGSKMDQEQLDAAATIKQNGQYLIRIINDILDLSKIEAGKLEIEQIPCSPCRILSEVLSLMQIPADAKNLRLEIEYDGPIPQSIQSDPTRLRQILINITGNAIKFTEVGGVRLVVCLRDENPDNPKMQFEVVDSGIGMTERQIAKLFTPFGQVDTSTTRKFGGTGLGLTISKRLAANLGGDITVRSTPGEGSRFTITVATGPLEGVKLLDEPSETRLPTDSDQTPAAATAKLDCRVLLAEDGPDNQRLIAFLLKKAGAEVVVAENGRVAHDLALAARDRKNPFHVILMDMQMPIMDGYDATAKLRKAGYKGAIIALTAHAMSTDRDKCLNAGCDDYTTKPIDRRKLVSLVAEYASRQEFHDANHVPVT